MRFHSTVQSISDYLPPALADELESGRALSAAEAEARSKGRRLQFCRNGQLINWD